MIILSPRLENALRDVAGMRYLTIADLLRRADYEFEARKMDELTAAYQEGVSERAPSRTKAPTSGD